MESRYSAARLCYQFVYCKDYEVVVSFLWSCVWLSKLSWVSFWPLARAQSKERRAAAADACRMWKGFRFAHQARSPKGRILKYFQGWTVLALLAYKVSFGDPSAILESLMCGPFKSGVPL